MTQQKPCKLYLRSSAEKLACVVLKHLSPGYMPSEGGMACTCTSVFRCALQMAELQKVPLQVQTPAYLAPKMRATSALARARDRAAFTFWGWLSGTTPLPMAVARKGMPVASTNFLS